MVDLAAATAAAVVVAMVLLWEAMVAHHRFADAEGKFSFLQRIMYLANNALDTVAVAEAVSVAAATTRTERTFECDYPLLFDLDWITFGDERSRGASALPHRAVWLSATVKRKVNEQIGPDTVVLRLRGEA